MNSSNIYDRTLFKSKFKEIYNSKNYSFPINDNFLSNLITKWKKESKRFDKTSALSNIYDYKHRLLIREFRNIYVYVKEKKNPVLLDYIIWGNDENISRMRVSKNLFIDATFHHPPEYKELLIFMYKDLIT